MNTQTITPAQIRTNHERAEKAAVKLSTNARRVTADCQPGKLAVLILETRLYDSRDVADFTEYCRYQTRVDQKIGNVVTYSNRFTTSNIGTMCWGMEEAEKKRGQLMGGLRSMEHKLLEARKEVERLEKLVANRRTELGMPGNSISDLDEIAAELNKKFTSSIYQANVVLDSSKEDGTTVWRVQYSDANTGTRLSAFDGLVRRTPNGVTSAL